MVYIKRLVKTIIVKGIGCPLPISLKNEYHLSYEYYSLESFCRQSPKVFCNINLDDQSPVFKQFADQDYGGKVQHGIANKFEHFLKHNHEVAITSFVIPNFRGNTQKFKDKFLLTNPEYSEWILYYSNLAKKYNLEYAIHGYFHLQKENTFFQSHTEFAFKNHKQTLVSISKAVDVFDKIGWPITGFRQPGWDLSTSINLPQIANTLNLKYIAANSYDAGYNSGGKERISNYYPTLISGVINFPQNIELDWPIDKIFQKIDFLVDIKALISIKAHFVDRDVCNCLNEENFIKLNKIADYIRSNFIDKIKFATLNTIADLIKHQIESK